MKLFLNKSIKLKIVIALIIALLASFAIPTFSNAGIKDSIGQMLFGALKWIFVKIGDGVVWLLNYTLMDNDETLKTVGEYDIPNYKISPEEIFKNKVPILDANVFSPLNDEHSTAKMLRGAISSVYNSLRYIALIALMCILIYLGIQIVIADNTGKKKAQYKTILQKWLIAVLLVFGLHYLMVGSMFLSDKLVEVFSAGNSSASFEVKVGTENVKTNLMGYVRCLIETEKDQVKAFSYVVIFWAIIILTILFALKYFERIAMLIFLIAIAPIVAATYPLDNSKSFNRWFKKYFSYLLMQPIDMLCYFVLILSATNLVTTNVIYAVVAIFFINKAEDMVRSIFGIDDPTGAKGAFGPQALAGYLGAKIGTASKNLSKSSGDNGGNSKSGEAQTKKPKEYDKNNNSGDARGDVKSKNTSIKTTGSGQEDGKIPTVDNPYDESSNVIGVNAIGDEKSDKDKLKDKDKSLEKGIDNPEGDIKNDINNDNINIDIGPDGKIRTKDDNLENKDSQGEGTDIKNQTIPMYGNNQTQDNNQEKPTRKIRTLNTRIKGAKSKFNYAGKKAVSAGAGAARFTGKAVKFATTAAGAVAIGSVAGIASIGNNRQGFDDAIKAVKAGAKVGANIGETIGSAPEVAAKAIKSSTDSIRDSYYKAKDSRNNKEQNEKESPHKDSIKEAKNIKENDDKKIINNKEIKEEFKEKFGPNYKEKMQEAIDLRDSGVKDKTIISNALEDKNYTKEQKITMAKFAALDKEKQKMITDRLKDKGVPQDKISEYQKHANSYRKNDNHNKKG